MKVKPPREKSGSFFKNKKFLTYLIGFFIIVLMVFSVMDLWQGSEGTSTYHNVEFIREERGWVGYIGQNAVLLAYDPIELENVSNVDFSALNSVQKIYLSSDSLASNYRSMDYFARRLPLNPPKAYACLPEAENVTECEQLPLKDCDDADDKVGVVIFERAENFSSSFFSSTCVLVQGEPESIMKVVDKAMLKMLGV